MSSVPYNKREYDVFISYSHADTDVEHVSVIAEWLQKIAGLKVWWDNKSLKAGDRLGAALPHGLSNARASLFFVSHSWVGSTWCEDEYNAALQERRKDRRYRMIALHMDDSPVPTFLANAIYLNLKTFQPEVAVALLEALIPETAPWAHGERDVFMSRSWHEIDAAAPDFVCAALMQNHGFRLIGDSPDYADFGENRVKHIMASCGAVVAVLPFRNDPANSFTSKWIIEEIELARELGRPYLLFQAEGVILDDTMISQAIGGRTFPLPQSAADKPLGEMLRRLEDEYRPSQRMAHSFFATSLKNSPRETDRDVRLIEQVTSMQCLLGQGFQGEQAQHAQNEIIKRIRQAEFVLADITANPLNTLIETGIALGAGTHLHIMCKKADSADDKTRFMFQTSDIKWYADELERIGRVHSVARKYRRRVYVPFSP